MVRHEKEDVHARGRSALPRWRRRAAGITVAAATATIGLIALGGGGSTVHSAQSTQVVDTTLCGTGAMAIGLGGNSTNCVPLLP